MIDRGQSIDPQSIQKGGELQIESKRSLEREPNGNELTLSLLIATRGFWGGGTSWGV